MNSNKSSSRSSNSTISQSSNKTNIQNIKNFKIMSLASYVLKGVFKKSTNDLNTVCNVEDNNGQNDFFLTSKQKEQRQNSNSDANILYHDNPNKTTIGNKAKGGGTLSTSKPDGTTSSKSVRSVKVAHITKSSSSPSQNLPMSQSFVNTSSSGGQSNLIRQIHIPKSGSSILPTKLKINTNEIVSNISIDSPQSIEGYSKASIKEKPKVLCCDKCDGKHETDDCPYYKKKRDDHPGPLIQY